ncbi:MAG: hypothetical protein M0C28_38995 [Candidatus Moduliflexus flocculans]|nr:hypothetical protein [Candidatus Moduliflexus flocculans]
MIDTRMKSFGGRALALALVLAAAVFAFAARPSAVTVNAAGLAGPRSSTPARPSRSAAWPPWTARSSPATPATAPTASGSTSSPCQKWPDKSMNKVYFRQDAHRDPGRPPGHRPDRRDPPGPRDLPLPEHGLPGPQRSTAWPSARRPSAAAASWSTTRACS